MWAKGICCFVIFFSIQAQAYLKHQVIVQRFQYRQFESLKNQYNPSFETLKVDEVIPKHLQDDLIDYDQKTNLYFGDVKNYVDLRHRDTPVLKQIGPRCSAYGLVAGMENLLDSPEKVKLSESHLFSAYRKYSSEKAVYAAKRMNITEYKYWPHHRRWIPKWGYKSHAHTRLTHITYIKNDIKKAVQALDAGRPVYLGMSVTRSMGNCDPIMDPDSALTGGGHAINISGYGLDKKIPGGGYFIIKNSWGKNCGDKGYQYMPFNYCMNKDPQYCIMWDLQGVKSEFKNVADVKPSLPVFDPAKINIDLKVKRKWFSKTKKFYVKFWGDSRHIKQVKEILVYFQSNNKTYRFRPSIDEIRFMFESQRDHQEITVYYKIPGDQWVIRDYRI